MIKFGKQPIRYTNMLIGTVNHVRAGSVPDNVELTRIKLMLDVLIIGLDHVFGELLHHIQGTRAVKGHSFYVFKIQIHVTIVNT
jgi:hypothetical protein